MILKKGLLTDLEKENRRMTISFWGRACFGWVCRSTANQHFSKVGLSQRGGCCDVSKMARAATTIKCSSDSAYQPSTLLVCSLVG